MTPRKAAVARTAGGATLRLVAVIRVSRRKGRQGPSFMAPEEQREAIEHHARMLGAEIVASFDETDSVSGKTVDREGLNAAMAMIMGGAADGLIVAKVDRFARTVVGGLTVIGKLKEADKRFIAATDGIDTHNPGRITKALLTFLLMMAEWQLDSLTEGWASVVQRHVAAGVSRGCPFGYMRCSDDRHVDGCGGKEHELHRRLVPDPTMAPHVRWIFERRAEGKSWTWVADQLTAKGVAPVKGEGWAYESVRAIVQCRTYLGELRSGDNVNLAAHAAIIDRELWERANFKQATAPRSAEDYLLHGLVRCASCGARMRGNSSVGRDGGITRYYRCRGRFSWGRCPLVAGVNADEVEALVEARFQRDYIDRQRWTAHRSTAELDAAVLRQRSAEAELDAWMVDPTTIRMQSVMGEASYQAALSARLDEVEGARAEVAAIESELLGGRVPAGLREAWPEMDDEARRSLLALVYPVVAVWPARRAAGATRASRWDAEPVADRVRIFEANDPARPAELPGIGGVSRVCPIPYAYA